LNNIAIITYPFISGLFYLAESFKTYQESLGNSVFFFPKKSFIMDGRKWKGIFKKELPNFLEFNENTLYGLQILNYCKKYRITKIYSFETFMKDSSWVDMAMKNGIMVYDIPMPEWSSKDDLILGKYKKFYKVYCLTNQSFSLFKEYSNVEKISWDYCPQINPVRKQRGERLTLYHPGSNYEINQKNTTALIESFKLIKNENIHLNISGHVGVNSLDERIKLLGKKISRQNVFDAYLEADCVISPSIREGLGMFVYEAKKFGCDLITSNIMPLNEHTRYLCRVSGYNQSDSLIPFAIIEPKSIAEQINKYYEDHYGK